MRQVNQEMVRAECIKRYGAGVAEVMFPSALEAITRQAAQYDAMESERDMEMQSLAELQARLPPLDPLRDAMNAAHKQWLDACHRLERQRVLNEAAESDLVGRVRDLGAKMAQHISAFKPESWRKSNLAQEPLYRESLADSQHRVQGEAHAQRRPR